MPSTKEQQQRANEQFRQGYQKATTSRSPHTKKWWEALARFWARVARERRDT